MNIGMEWIQIAMENGGHLDISISGRYFVARMRWENRNCVIGGEFGNVGSSLNSLDTALAEDAANEMIEEGAI